MARHLTAAVFRRLARGQIVQHAGCLSARQPPLRCGHQRTLGPAAITLQRRGFMGLDLFGERRPLAATTPRLEPGMAKLMEHAKRSRLRARPVSKLELLAALRAFFIHKNLVLSQGRKKAALLTDHQLELVNDAYTYIRQSLPELVEPGKRNREGWVAYALNALKVEGGLSDRTVPHQRDPVRVILAWRLYRDFGKPLFLARHFLEVLCLSGELERASESLAGKPLKFDDPEPEVLWTPEETIPSASDAQPSASDDTERHRQYVLSSYRAVMICYLHANNEQGLLAAREAGINSGPLEPLARMEHEIIMSRFYAANGAFDKAKKYYLEFYNEWKLGEDTSRYAPRSYGSLLDSCIAHGNTAWASELVNDILIAPRKGKGLEAALCRTVLVWAFKSGRTVGEVERMMTVLAQQTNYKPSTATYEALMDAALSREDAYSVERLILKMAERSLKPTITTKLLQIEARMTHGDLGGSLELLKGIGDGLKTQPHGEIDYGRDVAKTMNKLICAMCHSRKHSYDSIMSLASEVTDEGADFEPETVATLAVLHIARTEMEEAEDLLNTHAAQFSAAERHMIVDSIVEHCKDEATDSGLVWATYEILKKAFDDMNRTQRTAIMVQLAKKGRGSEAIHVFEQMKLHGREDTVPTKQTFIDCVSALGDARDEASVGGMYNMLKVDVVMEPDTSIYNSLLYATMKCGLPTEALHFWDRIAGSSEGPDMLSIQLAMRACASASFGASRASMIHNQLERAGFPLGPVYCGWLLGALAGQHKLDECFALMEQWQKNRGIVPTVAMVGDMLNAATYWEDKTTILARIEEKYPTIAPLAAKHYEEALAAAEAALAKESEAKESEAKQSEATA